MGTDKSNIAVSNRLCKKLKKWNYAEMLLVSCFGTKPQISRVGLRGIHGRQNTVDTSAGCPKKWKASPTPEQLELR